MSVITIERSAKGGRGSLWNIRERERERKRGDRFHGPSPSRRLEKKRKK